MQNIENALSYFLSIFFFFVHTFFPNTKQKARKMLKKKKIYSNYAHIDFID